MTENNNTKDPVTGLTEAEVMAVEDSWSMLYRKEHRKENGVKLFIKWVKYIRLHTVYALHISKYYRHLCIPISFELFLHIIFRLYTLYPASIERFPLFRGKTVEEISKHPKLPAHAMSVMYALASYVDNIYDTDLLVELVKKTAVSHIGRGVGSEDFKVSHWL